jgi:hypothetical protein
VDLNDRLRRAVASFPEVKLAVLFGSTARRQARPRFRVEAELGRAASREVDTVLLDDAPPLLRFEIARDGILLFEREDYLWTSFKARAMVDWWDWAPTHRMIAAGVAKRLREQVGHGQG